MSIPAEPTMLLPSASTFSFTAPFPSSSSTVKQRRVSLALPSSDSRQTPAAWNFRDDTGLDLHSSTDVSTPSNIGCSDNRGGKMRKVLVNDEDAADESQALPEKRQRKKWTAEETQNLVTGCNKWGVGNWKAILKDPDLKFDNRSPVDLKDRFRTYFPDAYKQHYPNAKTHLSSRIRSSLPDGKSLFEKTRSKKRRPFTEEEDRALKAGYEKHGTVWAAIVKDPIFQEQNRRSTDLRDRFRNAFPDLYEAAGYKPRPVAKKKRGESHAPVRAATDDQLPPISLVGPSRRKRAHTTEGLFRRGTKSVPQSTTNSDDEESSGDEDDTGSHAVKSNESRRSSQPEASLVEVEMSHCDQTTASLPIPDFMPSSSQISDVADPSQSQLWCPTPDTSQPWSATNPGSPTSSRLSSFEFFANQSPHHRRSEGPQHMIGKSAWGAQDWFSANPRLEPSTSFGSDSSYYGGLSPTPSSPFSFHAHTHGVVDRYDLFPTTYAHDFSSEVGLGDSHSTFSDQEMFSSSSFRGFTHHSNYAGDLIFGSRSHQPQQHFDYGLGLGNTALGLSGVQQPSSAAHSMQPASCLPGIDEIELNAITLNDTIEMDKDAPEMTHPDGDSPAPAFTIPDVCQYDFSPRTLEDLVGLSQHSTPPATPILTSRSARHTSSSAHNRSLSVPPSEHRPIGSHRQPVNEGYTHTKFPATPTRSMSLFDGLPTLSHQHHQQVQTHQNHQHGSMPPPSTTTLEHNPVTQPSSSSLADALKSHSYPYDLAFLDLHNYSTSAGHSIGMAHNTNVSTAEYAIERQGRALDLASHAPLALNASSAPPTAHNAKTLSVAPVMTQRFPSYTQSPPIAPYGGHSVQARTEEIRVHPTTAHSISSASLHHRGLSAVSPHDLMLKHGGDNKRKRASWDGGVL